MSKEIVGAAIVTGSSRGIGRTLARGMMEDGYGVLITSRSLEDSQQTAQELIEETGGRAAACKMDVSKREDVKNAIDICIKEFGSLDVMVNNAGYNKPHPFLENTEDTWHTIMNINALGVMLCMQEAGKTMRANKTEGKIINFASVAGRAAFVDFAPYCASKAAVISLTQAAAKELAANSIKVNAIAPGVIETPMWDELDKNLMEMGRTEKRGQAMKEVASAIALGRTATPEDVLGTARFLWSPASDYMTGQTLVIDGGMVMQ